MSHEKRPQIYCSLSNISASFKKLATYLYICTIIFFFQGTVTIPENTDDKNDNIENNDKDQVKSSNLQFLQITPTTVQVQFPDITGGNLKYVQERIFVNAQGQGKDVPWENAIILEGNEIFTLTGLEPRTNYR